MNQRKWIFVTLFTVVAGAAICNEVIRRHAEPEQNRGVANLGERYQPEQIRWEQELARTVAADTGQVQIGKKPSLEDKLLYGALEGRYTSQVVNGRVLRISLSPNQTPLDLSTSQLITRHAAVFKEARSYEILQNDGVTENLVLKNNQGQEIGKVSITRNDQGRVLNIEIQ